MCASDSFLVLIKIYWDAAQVAKLRKKDRKAKRKQLFRDMFKNEKFSDIWCLDLDLDIGDFREGDLAMLSGDADVETPPPPSVPSVFVADAEPEAIEGDKASDGELECAQIKESLETTTTVSSGVHTV